MQRAGEIVDGELQIIEVMQGANRDRGVEAPRRAPGFERAAKEARLHRCLGVDAHDLEAGVAQGARQRAVAATDLDHRCGRARQPALDERAQLGGQMRPRQERPVPDPARADARSAI